MKQILVVGAGISGVTVANLAAESGMKATLIDRKSHIGGNIADHKDGNGIMIHDYGSHIMHTSDKRVWKYLNKFTKFNTYMHKVIAVIDGIETTIPFNFNTIHDVFPESMAVKLEEKLLSKFEYGKKIPIMELIEQDDEEIKFLAKYVYEKVFLHYTMKQWEMSPKEIDNAVTARVPVYLSKDRRYFQDTYQGIPLKGYTDMVKKMLDHRNILVKLGTDSKNVDFDDYEHVFYTGSIDELLDYKYGVLPYRSIYFKYETHNMEHYQSNAVVNYPCNYDFTRIHEYKYYLNDKSDKTVIAKEYSEPFEPEKNERYYPIQNKENEVLYEKYLVEIKKTMPNVHILGRLGDYKYYDMDKAVKRAFEVFENVFTECKMF